MKNKGWGWYSEQKMRPHLGKMRPIWTICIKAGQKCSTIGKRKFNHPQIAEKLRLCEAQSRGKAFSFSQAAQPQLPNRSAPGQDKFPYELWRSTPGPLRKALFKCIITILEHRTSPTRSSLGRLICFLFKKGGLGRLKWATIGLSVCKTRHTRSCWLS